MFVSGALAGLGIAVPVGPIGVMLVDRAVRDGFVPTVFAGLGVATADFLYAAIAATGGSVVTGIIQPVLTPLRVLAVVVLMGIAIRNLVLVTRPPAEPKESDVGALRARTFLAFLGLTLLNPVTMIYFASLIVGLDVGSSSMVDRSLFVGGAFVGSASWQIFLVAAGGLAGARLGRAARRATSVLGSLMIIGLALHTAAKI